MTDDEIINNEKYHTCGRCKYDCTPDDKYPCAACIHGTDHRTDLWELESQSEQETNGSMFLKTYPDSTTGNVAYDDGVCYVYIDVGGSRTRFTFDWWNTSYKPESEEENDNE